MVKCSGLCLDGHEAFGLVEYANVIAYPDPDCPKHGREALDEPPNLR